MLGSDPTKKKKYTQWMLEIFTRLLKDSKYSDAYRFVCEDLPLATEYLTLFEQHKKKKLQIRILLIQCRWRKVQ